jgi:hypothetical protein
VSQGEAKIVVRARSVRESLDLAFPFVLRLGGARYVVLALAVQLPFYAGVIALGHAFSLSWIQVWLLTIPLATWSQGLFTLAAGELMFQDELRLAQVLRKFARRMVTYTLALAATRLTMALLVVVPIFVPLLWMRWLFIPEVILLEDASVTQGFARSSRLGKASRGAALELMFWIASVFAFAVVAAEAIGQAVFEYTLQLSFHAGSLFDEYGSYYAVLGFFLAVPVAATLRFLSYIDGRARRDAWEVQIRMQRIAQLAARAA